MLIVMVIDNRIICFTAPQYKCRVDNVDNVDNSDSDGDKKMTGGAPEVCSDKSLTLLTFSI